MIGFEFLVIAILAIFIALGLLVFRDATRHSLPFRLFYGTFSPPLASIWLEVIQKRKTRLDESGSSLSAATAQLSSARFS